MKSFGKTGWISKMSLIKKIAIIIVAGALSFSLIGCTSLDTNFMAKSEIEREYGRHKPFFGEPDDITKKIDDIEKEAESYKNPVIIVNENLKELGVGWNRNKEKDSNEDFRSLYKMEETGTSRKFKTEFTESYEDKNRQNGFSDEKTTSEEYNRIDYIKFMDEGGIIFYRNGKEGMNDRAYGYLPWAVRKEKEWSIFALKLIQIREDKNDDGIFTKDESVWEKEEHKSLNNNII